MLTFAFITLIVILFGLSQLINWCLRKLFSSESQFDDVVCGLILIVIYIVINIYIIKYIIIWGAQLIL